MFMENKIKFKRLLSSRGDSDGINLPKELIEFIGARVGEELTIIGDISKKGKFIAIFKE
jgi:hypothetical protein